MIAGIAERQVAYDQLLEQSPMDAWRHWQTLFAQNQVSELSLVNHALAQRMQQAGDEKVYEEIRSLLEGRDLPAEQTALLVGLLTETATPAALDILLAEALGGFDTELRRMMVDGIREIGDRRWEGRFHPELSPTLEAAWSQVDTADTDLLNSLAVTLAKAGAPNGVEHLVAAVAESDKTMRQIKQGQDARAHAALNALQEIRNPEAIPVLVKWFNSALPTDTAFIASGDALAAMGLPEATKILLEWAKQAADEAASLAGKWFGEVRDTESVRLFRGAVSQGEVFRSQQVRQKLVESFKMLGSAAE